jgi:hypothetical protein
MFKPCSEGEVALIPLPVRHDKSCVLRGRHHLEESDTLAKLLPGFKLLWWHKGIYVQVF